MQKLIWTNSKGDLIDLTAGNFGITEWEGFSNAPLNIQTQSVPFQDGGVFLDALIEQRELSVTLSMKDDNDLELRYRQRMELNHIMNPKLGEGYLIYKNDYTQKRIKCIPQIPLFPTHNSNTPGTPKANLSWTACEPYWEDLEETRVFLKAGLRTIIENKGDADCGVRIDILTNNVTNPQIKSFTENKLIKLNGTFHNGINIDTNFGQKSINSEKLGFNTIVQGSTLNSITYSENLGLFVAVGINGAILTSLDGVNWVSRNNPISSGMLYSIIYSENLDLFVAVGYVSFGKAIILTSSDGINWDSRNDSILCNLYSITYSENLNLFVAVGDYHGDGVILTSSNGINWNKITDSVIENSTILNSITYSENLGLFVATGKTLNYVNIFTSSDGISWAVKTIESLFNSTLNSITYSENLGLFVAVGNGGSILTSSNGINWQSQNSGVSYNLKFVTYLESLNMFIAVGYSALRSLDGIAWERGSSGISDLLNSITYSENLGLFVAVGINGAILTSLDGVNYSRNSHPPYATLNSITYSENLGLFVAVGNGGSILTSSNKINWESRNSGTNKTLTSIVYSKNLNLFVIVGDTGTILTSSDGINWQSQNSGSSFILKSITYSENLGLFVTITNDVNDITILTSSDGINWDRNLMNIRSTLYNVMYSEDMNLFVITGSNELILTSSDGINWVQRNAEISPLSIAYSKNLGLFVGISGSGVLKSSDGINWVFIYKSRGYDYDVSHLIYSEYLGLFIGVSGGKCILTSSDGINWNKITDGITSNLNSVIYIENSKEFITVGNGGFILQSVFTPSENLISSLSPDSDMTFSLKIGKNDVLLNEASGNLNSIVSYRQKYIGV